MRETYAVLNGRNCFAAPWDLTENAVRPQCARLAASWRSVVATDCRAMPKTTYTVRFRQDFIERWTTLGGTFVEHCERSGSSWRSTGPVRAAATRLSRARSDRVFWGAYRYCSGGVPVHIQVQLLIHPEHPIRNSFVVIFSIRAERRVIWFIAPMCSLS
jgi:hypothetical protein